MTALMTTMTTAYSIDGRTFRFTADVATGLTSGAYIRVDADNGMSCLGRIIEIEASDTGTGRPVITGSGVIRARVEDGDIVAGAPTAFGAARISIADPGLVAAHFRTARRDKAGLEIGTLGDAADPLPATLLASGFGRHTLVCGQSGSGKTYTLGVMLERLLLNTDLRMIVLDPNSDYIRLAELRDPDAAQGGLADRYAAATRRLSVFGNRPGQIPLRSRFGRLPLTKQALVLNLDPIRDAREYNAFRRIVRDIGSTEYTLTDVRHRASALHDDASRDLAMRIENLDVEELGIWAQAGEPTLLDLVPQDWRALVFDLGSLPSSGEASLLAASLVSQLWKQRQDRIPTLLVIDEAHNVCPQIPLDRFQEMASADLTAIAGEGRKFGIYLLLVTQRPQKLQVNVLSQCENLVLMRMNSAEDIEHLAASFSHVPASLVRQAAGFGLGQGLVGGPVAPDPLLFRTGTRHSVEGGSDIPSTWAGSRTG